MLRRGECVGCPSGRGRSRRGRVVRGVLRRGGVEQDGVVISLRRRVTLAFVIRGEWCGSGTRGFRGHGVDRGNEGNIHDRVLRAICARRDMVCICSRVIRAGERVRCGPSRVLRGGSGGIGGGGGRVGRGDYSVGRQEHEISSCYAVVCALERDRREKVVMLGQGGIVLSTSREG